MPKLLARIVALLLVQSLAFGQVSTQIRESSVQTSGITERYLLISKHFPLESYGLTSQALAPIVGSALHPLNELQIHKTKHLKRMAVSGGGLYGLMTAVMAAAAGHQVVLYEKQRKLMRQATGASHLRLHRGYYYPQNPDTAEKAHDLMSEFLSVFGQSVVPNTRHYYAIAKNNNLHVTPKGYLAFLEKHRLPHQEEYPGVLNRSLLEYCVSAGESFLDLDKMRYIGETLLSHFNVVIKWEAATQENLNGYDFVVHASYAALNALLNRQDQIDLAFQLNEQVVVRLPEEFKKISLVIFGDGIIHLDPFRETDFHLIGSSKMAREQRTAKFPTFPKGFDMNLLDAGIVRPSDPSVSIYPRILEVLNPYFPSFDATYQGSIFTIKTVVPKGFDEFVRPACVQVLRDGRQILVLGGKVVEVISAARQVLGIIEAHIIEDPFPRIAA